MIHTVACCCPVFAVERDFVNVLPLTLESAAHAVVFIEFETAERHGSESREREGRGREGREREGAGV